MLRSLGFPWRKQEVSFTYSVGTGNTVLVASRKQALQNQLPPSSSPQPYWHHGLVLWKTVFLQNRLGVGIWMISKWLEHITFIVHFTSLFLLHLLHLRSSGIRYWRLGTPHGCKPLDQWTRVHSSQKYGEYVENIKMSKTCASKRHYSPEKWESPELVTIPGGIQIMSVGFSD